MGSETRSLETRSPLKRSTEEKKEISREAALRFVLLLGVVSLLADMTYEGARSITGPFLGELGASAAVVGLVAGFGELVGYGLRLVSGYISDRTGRYWAVTFIGYVVNLLAVPLLALAGRWEIAAALMIAERMGKAIRNPARDAMLSHATKRMGRGWGFGLHEAMDQIGAILGPTIVAAVLYFRGGYRFGFGVLLFPALLALGVLFLARLLYPRPRDFELDPGKLETTGFGPRFWFYLAAVAFIAAGYVDFPLIAYHLKKVAIVKDDWIPMLYALAMGVDALAALLFGRLFDKFGFTVLALVTLVTSLFAPLVFFGNFHNALLGMSLWGAGMGAQESIMRAAIAEMIPANRRGAAYGLFNTGYGVFWFLGSALMGILYDSSLVSVVILSWALQLISVPLLLIVKKVPRQ